eukprot:403375423
MQYFDYQVKRLDKNRYRSITEPEQLETESNLGIKIIPDKIKKYNSEPLSLTNSQCRTRAQCYRVLSERPGKYGRHI